MVQGTRYEMRLGLVETSAVDKAIAQELQRRPVASSRLQRSREAEMRRELEGKGREGWQGARAGRQLYPGVLWEARQLSRGCSGSPGKTLGLILRAMEPLGRLRSRSQVVQFELEKEHGAAESRSMGGGGQSRPCRPQWG